MATETLTPRTSQHHLSMFYLRRSFQLYRGYHLILVLSCILFCLVSSGPCAMRNHLMSLVTGMQDPLDYDACGSYDKGPIEDFFMDDISSNYVKGTSPTCLDHKNVCTNSEFFCFLSTLPGCLSQEYDSEAVLLDAPGSQDDGTLPEESVLHGMWESNSSWLSDNAAFMLSNERIVSCALNSGKELQDMSSPQNKNVGGNDIISCGGPLCKYHWSNSSPYKSSEVIKSGVLDGSSSPHVEINPPLLDWGQKYLYFPSLAFLTVANTCNDSILHVYEPFSTDTQFYPCDFDEVLLKPGEVAEICFVFLPKWLGFSSAHLVLQTSSGGFLVHARGLAVESPYRVQPLVGLDVSSDGSQSKSLSLHNPFNDTLHVEEVTAWISVSLGNVSHSAEAVCKLDTFRGFDEFSPFLNVKEWLDIKSGQVGLPLIGIRPHKSWNVDPLSTETIIDIDFSSGPSGKLFGAFCIQLRSSSEDWADTVVVPLEAEINGKAAYSGLMGLVSVSLEAIVPCDSSETVAVSLSLRNGAPYLLNVVKIIEVTENTKLFQIKYMEGLILFPATVTQIALITYSLLPTDSQDPPLESPNIISNCKLLIVTNDSGSPQIEIPCQDVVHTCSRHPHNSFIGLPQPEEVNSGNGKTESLGSDIRSSSHIKLNALAEADELLLRNWRSQGSTSSKSVLDDRELLFPMVQVGTHCSKWISVKNPSHRPVLMQLVLHSGTIIDQCKSEDEHLQHLSLSSLVHNESTTPTRYGFSVVETAITEAYVHPYERAIFGPIVFHPSNRCGWRSSALIRNNLSGVEWLPLQGFGGSVSLVLLEEARPVQSLEFNLNMPNPLNVSQSALFFPMEDTSIACSQPLSKELFAKNTGDLPLEVKRIIVSGADCRLDGFMVHTCKGFSLEPGESMRLMISYQTDLSAAMVHRDLELVFPTGILVIPMKANLPIYMLNLCRKSFLWTHVKKFSLVVFVAAAVTFLVFCCIFPQTMALSVQDYLFKSERNFIATISSDGKHFSRHCNQRNSRSSVYDNMDRMFRSVGECETSTSGFTGKDPDFPGVVQEQRVTSQHKKEVHDDREVTIGMLNRQEETSLLPSFLEEKSLAVDESFGLLEAPQTSNLTVRIDKERGRRRRRKRRASGTGAGVTGLLEVSSSQSGNSTPSSPLSPSTFFMAKRTCPLSPDVDHAIEARNPFVSMAHQNHGKEQVFEAAIEARIMDPGVSAKYCNNNWLLSAQEQLSESRKTSSKPVLLPSATFPCTGRHAGGVVSPASFLASTSAIALHARAPGSKLYKETTAKAEEKTGFEDKFTYNIWGNHFPGFLLMGRAKSVSTMISNTSQGDSQSFFVRGPQTLMQKAQARSISPTRRLPYCAVSCSQQNG